MRVLVAILFALLGAFVGAKFLGPPVIDWFEQTRHFRSPDQALEAQYFAHIVTIFVSLVAGWFLGWYGAGLFTRRRER